MGNAPIYQQLNETGTILVRTTLPPNHPLPEFIQQEFSAVALFFAAMLRAISTAINPKTGNPFSIYNYHAQESILLGSGRFIKLSEDSFTFKTHKFIEKAGKILFSELFNMNLRERERRKISSILSGVNKEVVRMIETNHPNEFRAGFIIFIVEYINGVSNISVKSIFINRNDYNKNKRRERFLHRFFIKTSFKMQIESYLYISKNTISII